jgi:hypothetical protein
MLHMPPTFASESAFKTYTIQLLQCSILRLGSRLEGTCDGDQSEDDAEQPPFPFTWSSLVGVGSRSEIFKFAGAFSRETMN